MEEQALMTEGTTPMEEATAPAEETETAAEESAPQDEEQTVEETENGASDTEGASEETTADVGFSIRYNHEDLTLTRDEAVRLAQLGKHHESDVQPMLDELDYVATLQGKTVKDLIRGLSDGVDRTYREKLKAELGADNPLVEELVGLRRQKNQQTYEAAKTERAEKERQAAEAAQQSATAKIAEQFEGLRELFPELDTIEKVPDVVIKRALKSGDLEKEMLRYERSERKAVQAATETAAKNKQENVGSAASAEKDVTDSVTAAMMRGLWG